MKACLQSPLKTDAGPHEFQTSNGSVYGEKIGLIHTWISVSSTTSESSCKFWLRELKQYMICGPVAATVGVFNEMLQYINKHSFLPVLFTLSLSTFVCNMHVSPC